MRDNYRRHLRGRMSARDLMRQRLATGTALLLTALGSAQGFLGTAPGLRCRAMTGAAPGINAGGSLGLPGARRRFACVSAVRRLSMRSSDDADAVSIRRAAPTGLTVGIPKENGSAQNTVAADPKTVERIVASCGYSVIVESCAGVAAGHRSPRGGCVKENCPFSASVATTCRTIWRKFLGHAAGLTRFPLCAVMRSMVRRVRRS
jgi:hypothetical protein